MPDPSVKEPEAQKASSLHIFEGTLHNRPFKIAYTDTENPSDTIVMWGHGWGQSHESFLPLVNDLKATARHIVIDFPGFGKSPRPFKTPQNSWGSKDYADAVAHFIQVTHPNSTIIWIGHSFGCRVGAQLGAFYPELIKSMIFIAGAGLKRHRGFIQAAKIKTKILIFKAGKTLRKIPFIASLLKGQSFGSNDYKQAGAMRGTLVKVVNENLIDEARRIACPVLLIYGSKDDQTPPEIGEKYKSLIKKSEMVHLPGQDHYSVLSEGRHSVAALIKKFIKRHTSE